MASNDDFYLRHPRMPLSERAKIFIPFEPLKGYRALLAERERKVLEEHRPFQGLPEDEDFPPAAPEDLDYT